MYNVGSKHLRLVAEKLIGPIILEFYTIAFFCQTLRFDPRAVTSS